ncbi:MAG: HD domain-containing phosphohydrolase [bacterium]
MPKCPKCTVVYRGKLTKCPSCGANLSNNIYTDESTYIENQAFQGFFNMARSISSTLDLDALLKKIGISAEKLLNAEASSIMLKVEGVDQLYFKTATGPKSQEVKLMKVPIGTGIAGWVAREMKPLIVNDVEKDNRFTKDFDRQSSFSTRSILCVPMVVDNELIGVVEVLNKIGVEGFSVNDLNLLSSLSGLAAVAVMNAKLVESQKNFFANIIELLVNAVEMRDPRMNGHAFRVAQMACAIGKKLSVVDQDYKVLYYGALLHDIGMLGVTCDGSHSSSGQRNPDMTQKNIHSVLGCDMIKDIMMLKNVGPIIRHHHEYFDGSGLPDKLKGNDIPLGSRIISLLEDVEGIRLKNEPMEKYFEEVEELVKDGSGKKYDPRVAKAFLQENKIQKDYMI